MFVGGAIKSDADAAGLPAPGKYSASRLLYTMHRGCVKGKTEDGAKKTGRIFSSGREAVSSGLTEDQPPLSSMSLSTIFVMVLFTTFACFWTFEAISVVWFGPYPMKVLAKPPKL